MSQQISDSDVVGVSIDEAILANSQTARDYLEGKESAIQFLVGQVMRITRDKANLQVIIDQQERRLIQTLLIHQI